MNTFKQQKILHRVVWGTSALLLSALACSPIQDTFMGDDDGQAPRPTASLKGTVSYMGPAPSCDEKGEVIGLAFLSIFSTDAPPPPAGSGLPVSAVLV